MVRGTEGYGLIAPTLLRKRLPFAEVHAPILHLIPTQPTAILDIGSGPGHDAATLAGMGHAVTAVEPTPELLQGAMALYRRAGIRWIVDALPRLETVSMLGLSYGFILMSGVWTHLDESERREAMPTVARLLEPAGVLVLSLRHGPAPVGRRMFEVTGAETVAEAGRAGLRCLVEVERGSIQPHNRSAGVTWTILAFIREVGAKDAPASDPESFARSPDPGPAPAPTGSSKR